MSMQVSYKKQIVFFTLFLILILGVLEIVANIWWINETKCSFQNNEVFAQMNDEELEKICQDQINLNMNEFFILPDQNLNSVNINSLGFRGGEFNIEKNDNTFRIFFVGGSTAFGSGSTSDKTTIPGYLQKLFNQENFNYKIEVINAGKGGFNSFTEKTLVLETIQYLQPDLIIMYDGWNDIRADYKPEFSYENWKQVCDLGQDDDFDVVLILQPTLVFGEKPLTKQEYSNFLVDADYFGFKMTQKKEIYQQYWKKMNEIDSCTNIYDLRDVFENTTEPIYYDGGHMSDRGNEIIAKKISNILGNQLENSNPKNYVENNFKNFTGDSFQEASDISRNEDTKKIINFGKIYLEIRGLLTFYKTPIFLESIFK